MSSAQQKLMLGLATLLALSFCHAVHAGDHNVWLQPPMVMNEDIDDSPAVGSWNYSDPNTNIYCILSVMAVRMTFERSDIGVVTYDLPVNDTSTNGSRCDNSGDPISPADEVLSIRFFNDDFNLRFQFNYSLDLTAGTREWYIEEISLDYSLTAEYFPDITGSSGPDSISVDNLDLARARVKQAFRCDYQVDLEQEELSDLGVKITFSTWNLDLEPYRDRTDMKMSFPARCRIDQVIDPLIPSIIGGVLAGIVTVCLVIYFMMRKKRDRGYTNNDPSDLDRKSEIST